MTIRCSDFDDALLELAYGELSEEVSEQLRTHATSCQRCQRALEDVLITRKLTAQISQESPTSAVDSAILSLAEEACVSHAQSHVTTPGGPAQSEGTPGLLERLRSLLLTPAIATAAAAGIVFFVTLALNEPPKAPSAPEHAYEAFPEGKTSPVAPQSESLDSRKSESPSREQETSSPQQPGISAAARQIARTHKPIYQPDEGASKAPSATRESGATTRSLHRGGNLGTAGPPPAEQTAPTPGASAGLRQKRSRSPRLKLEDEAVAGESLRGFALDNRRSVQEKTNEQISGPVTQGAREQPNTMDAAMTAYSRGDCHTAKEILLDLLGKQSTSTEDRANAQLHIARCEKRGGRCGSAVSIYERYLADYPGHGSVADGLWEIASCYVRLGQKEDALRKLEILSHIPEQRARAETEINRIKTASRR